MWAAENNKGGRNDQKLTSSTLPLQTAPSLWVRILCTWFFFPHSSSCAWCTLLPRNVFSYDEQLNLGPQTFIKQMLLDRHSATEMKRSIFLEMLSESLLLFSRSAMFDSVRPCGLQHARLPCPSSHRACSNSCPSGQWCHQTISFSVVPFSSYLQSFRASGSFPISPLFTSGGQSIEASASSSVLPMNIQGWFPLELTGLISLESKGLSRVFSNTTVQKHQFFGTQLSLWSNSHIHTWLLEKP